MRYVLNTILVTLLLTNSALADKVKAKLTTWSKVYVNEQGQCIIMGRETPIPCTDGLFITMPDGEVITYAEYRQR